MPSLEMARRYCEVSRRRRRPCSVRRRRPSCCCGPRPSRASRPASRKSSPYLGVMLPYSPLHHLLMRECGFPVVATSGNRSDEPIAIDNDEARSPAGRDRRPVRDARPPHRAALRRFGGAPGARARERAAPRPRLRAAAGARRPNSCRRRAGRGRAPEEHGGHRRRPAGLRQPARRRPRHRRGARRLRARHRGPLPPLPLRAASWSPATCIPTTPPPLGARFGSAGRPRPAPPGARRLLRRRERRAGRVSGRGLGRHRLRARRHHLGRRVLPGARGPASSASRICARSACPAARRPSRRAGARRPACSTRPSDAEGVPEYRQAGDPPHARARHELAA